MTDKEITRREFIKGTVTAIGGLIGAVIAIPSIVYLLSPALQAKEDTDLIDLGSLEIIASGFQRVLRPLARRLMVGSELQSTMVCLWCEKVTVRYASFQIFAPIWAVASHGMQIKKTTLVPATTVTLISWEMSSAVLLQGHWMNI